MTDAVCDRGNVRRDALVLLGFMALLLIPSLFTRDLWNPDEPRYMEVARQMTVTGNYLVPHLNGQLYPDKPPMFFWLTALLLVMANPSNSGVS